MSAPDRTSEGSWNAIQSWGDTFLKTPCVPQSYLLGVGTSSLVFAHKLRLYPGRRNLPKAVNAMILTFCLITPLNFVICANSHNQRHRLIKEAFADRNIKQSGDKK